MSDANVDLDIEFPDELPVVELGQEYLEAMREFQALQIIGDDPSDQLREIYQKRVLIDFSYLKAEKWYSPEHQAELRELQASGEIGDEIPKNVINSNFVKLIKLFEVVMKIGKGKEEKSMQELLKEVYQALMNLMRFVKQFTEVKYEMEDVCIYEPLMDVRFCQDLTQYFNYLLTFKYMELAKT